MPDNVQIPEATTVFECQAGSFEADPFALWEAVQKIATKVNEEKQSDFVFWTAIKEHIQETYHSYVSVKQAAWFAENIKRICLEKKSDSSPSVAPVASTASPSSDYPTTSEEY